MEQERIIEAEVVSEEQDISELKPVVTYDNEISKFVTNIPEMKEALKTGLAWYDYEVTEATKEDAMADRAKLNKLETNIVATRKFYAEKFNYWASTENSIKELEKMIKAASDKLNRGIKSLDLKAEQEKTASIKAYWDSLQTGIDYALVHNVSFKNKGYTEKKWKTELDAKAAQIAKERDFVKAMLDAKTEFNEAERQQVFACFNSSKREEAQTMALNKIVEIEEAKERAKAIEEQKRLEAEQRAKEQEYLEQHQEATLSEAANMTQDEPIWTLNLVMVGKKEAFQDFLKQTNFFEIAEQNNIVIKEKKWSKK